MEKAKDGIYVLKAPGQGCVHKGCSVAPLLRVSRASAGFTLIEIVVVLVIISMAMMIVIPRLPSSESENLKSSARTLASTLRYLQDRAATGRTTYYLREMGCRVAADVRQRRSGETLPAAHPLLQQRPVREGIQVADVFIPRLGKINDGQLRLEIGMGGLRDFVVIHLRSTDSVFWTVMAFPSSGKVKVYDGYQEEPL